MITVEALVNAPMEKVWDFWTNPEHITKWYQASDDWHAPEAENDLQAGGKFKTVMAAKDGSVNFDFTGTYDEIILNKLISYTLEDGRKVRIEFTPKDNSVFISEAFDPENIHPPEFQKAGWQAILDSFKNHTENN